MCVCECVCVVSLCVSLSVCVCVDTNEEDASSFDKGGMSKLTKCDKKQVYPHLQEPLRPSREQQEVYEGNKKKGGSRGSR